MTEVAEEGLWGPSIPFLSQRGPGGARQKSNLVHFYPQNIPSEESKLSDFCGIREHLKVENDISALFCNLGCCTIYYVWEANLCVWGLSPMPTRVHAFVEESTPAPAAPPISSVLQSEYFQDFGHGVWTNPWGPLLFLPFPFSITLPFPASSPPTP